MITPDLKESIFPKFADGADDAAVLHHVCGVDIQFYVAPMDGEEYTVTQEHLKSWGIEISAVGELAGLNCFSYNTLRADPDGVYHDDDGNVFAILLDPGTFIEHNEVEGKPLLLVINADECILTGSESQAGVALQKEHLDAALAARVVAIDSDWKNWIRS